MVNSAVGSLPRKATLSCSTAHRDHPPSSILQNVAPVGSGKVAVPASGAGREGRDSLRPRSGYSFLSAAVTPTRGGCPASRPSLALPCCRVSLPTGGNRGLAVPLLWSRNREMQEPAPGDLIYGQSDSSAPFSGKIGGYGQSSLFPSPLPWICHGDPKAAAARCYRVGRAPASRHRCSVGAGYFPRREGPSQSS